MTFQKPNGNGLIIHIKFKLRLSKIARKKNKSAHKIPCEMLEQLIEL